MEIDVEFIGVMEIDGEFIWVMDIDGKFYIGNGNRW
jgi:chemotaxis signal transduction protein